MINLSQNRSMRALINVLSEDRDNQRFFLHVTAVDNLKSIVAHGLVANHHTQYGVEWASLDGIYVTDKIELIAHMIENRDDLSKFAIVLVEGIGDIFLPDEDIINIILEKYHDDKIKGKFDEDDHEEIIAELTRLFAAHVGAMTHEVHELIDDWYNTFVVGGDVDPFAWAEKKDNAVRLYRTMAVQGDTAPHSFRYPGSIGFEGNPRIVAVLSVAGKRMKITAGKVPSEAEHLIQDLSDRLDLSFRMATKNDKALLPLRNELLALAKEVNPAMPVAQMRAIIWKMDRNGLEAEIKLGKEKKADRAR